jgi:hypothetical protein
MHIKNRYIYVFTLLATYNEFTETPMEAPREDSSKIPNFIRYTGSKRLHKIMTRANNINHVISNVHGGLTATLRLIILILVIFTAYCNRYTQK